eukprot:gene2685-3881_t
MTKVIVFLFVFAICLFKIVVSTTSGSCSGSTLISLPVTNTQLPEQQNSLSLRAILKNVDTTLACSVCNEPDCQVLVHEVSVPHSVFFFLKSLCEGLSAQQCSCQSLVKPLLGNEATYDYGVTLRNHLRGGTCGAPGYQTGGESYATRSLEYEYE